MGRATVILWDEKNSQHTESTAEQMPKQLMRLHGEPSSSVASALLVGDDLLWSISEGGGEVDSFRTVRQPLAMGAD